MKILAPTVLALLTGFASAIPAAHPQTHAQIAPAPTHVVPTACGNSGDACRYDSDCCSGTCLRNDTCR